MTDSFAHCERLVREADTDRFFAALFAPAERRPYLFALYAFNLEIARVRDLAREPMPGEIRLQWWREVIAGMRPEEAGAHPVAAALLETVARHGLSAATLLDVIEARSFDLYDDPMPTLDALETYARRTSSALIAMAARSLGVEDRSAADLAGPAGTAHAITGLLRAFALHISRRQLFVPIDLLDRHAVRPEDLFAGISAPGLGAALAELRRHARVRLEIVRERIAAIPPSALPAFLPVAVLRLHLARMERRDYDPFSPPTDVPQWRRQWALWRATRHPETIARV